jgi:hypothetical protein
VEQLAVSAQPFLFLATPHNPAWSLITCCSWVHDRLKNWSVVKGNKLSGKHSMCGVLTQPTGLCFQDHLRSQGKLLSVWKLHVPQPLKVRPKKGCKLKLFPAIWFWETTAPDFSGAADANLIHTIQLTI